MFYNSFRFISILKNKSLTLVIILIKFYKRKNSVASSPSKIHLLGRGCSVEGEHCLVCLRPLVRSPGVERSDIYNSLPAFFLR
jgi:hypothetical protein